MRIPALLTAALLLPLPLAQTAAAAAVPRLHGASHGPALRGATTTAGHRSTFAKDLSVQVSPPSFPTAPGAVGKVLVTICNNGTETPTSATLVVNGPANPGLTLVPGPFQSGPVDGGWNWTRFPVAQNLKPASCETDTIFANTISTTPGPAGYPGGTAVVTWDPSQNPNDNSTTWSFDTSAPVNNAVLELVRPPKPAAPGNPADFEVLERNLGPSSGYPVPGKVVATLPAGSKFLSSAPDYRPCAISADGTTATCDDDVLNTWANVNRGFALQVDPHATPGTSIPVTVTQLAPGNPAPHRFTLTVLIPVC
ncbi:hypothetical protein ABH930_003063 [Kitasatospora sp. GAS204A]|uniref:hypothetical protein n=1 Tax=unclassified Kitasatospora TaxID=2633591 RepID=UPI002473B723|nr:hypothetical protein [Kitasatospora sp. GAS204B]MDH6117576.1 hypothetical protein [Kitasatospora sp. GAS204B]